jgi:uncharacterized delta-60 repeat protein
VHSPISFLKSAASIVAIALAVLAHAEQDGAYDPSFGSVGQTWIDVTPSSADEGTRLIRLPSGNLFMAGSCGGVTCAAWLTPSGALASGYGTSGTGTVLFSAFAGWPNDASGTYDAAAFPDGRIAVIPGTQDNGYIALLRADGTGLDPSVGNGVGFVAPPFLMLRLRVTAQQQVIVAGITQTSPAAIVVARFDSTLHIDTSFGSGGSTVIGFPDGSAFPSGMTLQRDGKIVVIGTVGSQTALAIVRLTANGAPDPAFGINSDGRFESTFGNQYGTEGNDIVEDKKGRLVFAGLSHTDSAYGGKWFVNRLLSGGAPDPTFNGGQPQVFAIFSSSTDNSPQACCVALQSDNRIVVAGTMDRPSGTGRYFAIARFLDNGAFDSTWGNGGQSYGDMSTQAPNVLSDYPMSMVIVGGGILVGGSTTVNGGETRFSVTKTRTDLLLAADFE